MRQYRPLYLPYKEKYQNVHSKILDDQNADPGFIILQMVGALSQVKT